MTRLHRAIRISINTIEHALVTTLAVVFFCLGCICVGSIIWLVLHGVGVV
jgi:hypothetical protein